MIVQLIIQTRQIFEENIDRNLTALSELLRAHRRGYHIVIIDRDTASYLLEMKGISAHDLATLTSIRNQYTQTGGLAARAAVKLEISESYVGVTYTNGVIKAGILSVDDTDILNIPAFIVEDEQYDGGFYKYIIEKTSETINVPRPSVEVIHGGGERIFRVLCTKAKEGRLIGVIFDSDRSWPGGDAETKLRRVSRDLDHAVVHRVLSFVTPGREVENFLPLSALKLLPVANEREEFIAILSAVEESERQDGVSVQDRLHLFVDIKNGFSPRKFANIVNPDEKTWFSAKCVAPGFDPESDEVSGFGASVIRQFLANKEAQQEMARFLRTADWEAIVGPSIQQLAWLFAGGLARVT